MATTLQDRLAEAEQAYHDLQMGKSVRVFVDQNGERVEYTAIRSNLLAAYIADLKRQIAGTGRGPMYLV